MVYILLILLVAATIAAVVLAKVPTQKPPALQDLSVPTAQDGRPVTVVFGTCWVADPNVVYYGNLRTRPIKASGGK